MPVDVEAPMGLHHTRDPSMCFGDFVNLETCQPSIQRCLYVYVCM